MAIESLSASVWFILTAYIAAFLPWTALFATDFIGPKWKSVKDTRLAGQWNVLFSVAPACYIVAYIVVQGKASDYTEMCAALVALVFSVIHLLRTAWGLWQLRYFRRWVSSSIDALDAMGVPYCLENKRVGTRTSTETADDVLVNETIIDNQLMHGEARCYLKYSDLSLQPDYEVSSPIVRQLYLVFQCIRFVLLWPVHQLGAVFGQRSSNYKLEQVPFQPVNVWLKWSVAFASQGLGSWIKEFSAAEDPKNQPGYDELTARERFDRRAHHFSSEVLASAWLQLWPELSLAANSASPLHWDAWDEKSNMADGRLVKAELFERAVRSGEALPFGAPHAAHLLKTSGTLGYHAYRRMLAQVVNDLPVQAEFNSHIEGFDVERLEWLTTLLYLGTIAMNIRRRDTAMRDDSSTREPGSSTTAITDTEETDPDDSGFANSQALANLRTQLNLPTPSTKATDAGGPDSVSHLLQYASISIKGPSNCYYAEENRHALKVGELIDVWLALVSGDQMSFMVDMNGSSFWEDVCCGSDNGTESQGHIGDAQQMSSTMQSIHAEVEKRRLYYNFVNKAHCYDHMDQFVTFMGYRMESVRSRLACWVRDQEGPILEECFRPMVRNEGALIVELTNEFSQTLLATDISCSLTRRSVQTRLLWELQQGLTRVESGGPESINSIALCILSFPSLGLQVQSRTGGTASCVADQSSVRVNFCPCLSETPSPLSNSDMMELPEIKVCPIGGPQHCDVSAKLSKNGQNLSVAISVHFPDQGSRFEWIWWRNAFLGRLLGMKEWQEQRNIPSAQLQLTVGKMNHRLQVVTARTKEHFSVWPGWKPFRFGFTQFELESEGLLKEQSEIERVEPTHLQHDGSIGMGVFSRMQAAAVKYADASPVVLRHAYLLLEETFLADYAVANAASEDDGVKDLIETAKKCQKDDVERAALLFEIAATNHGDGSALERCIDLAIDDAAQISRASRAVAVLENFVAQLLPTSSFQQFKLSLVDIDKVTNYVLPSCQKVMHHFGEQLEISDRLSRLFEIVWWSDPERFMDQALSGLQVLYCLSKSPEVLWEHARSLWHTGASDSFNAKIRVGVQRLTAAEGEIMTNNDLTRRGLTRDCFQFRKHLLRNALRETKVPGREWVIANHLALTLQKGVDGVDADACGAVALYHLAIEEGNDVRAMHNLASLLRTGGDGVEADAREAVALYRRAIEEGSHVPAMNNLALLLETGADGVEADAREAVALYRRTIEERDYVPAMNNLALLLKTGGDGVEADALEAVALYRRAVEEGNNVPSMYNLAMILHTGGDGVEADALEAVALYRRAIEEGNNVPAMCNLALLLHTGGDGVEADAREAVALYERAIGEGSNVYAPYGLANVLETGADGVDANEERAATLYEQVGDFRDAGERLAALRRRLDRIVDDA